MALLEDLAAHDLRRRRILRARQMFAVMKGCVESPYTVMFWTCFMQIITSVTQSLIYNAQNSLIVMRSSPVHINTKDLRNYQ